MNIADNMTLSANVVDVASSIFGFTSTLNDSGTVDVTVNGTAGSGTTTVGVGGSMRVGSSDKLDADATLDTNTLTDTGTVTVGGLAGGSPGTIDAVFATIGNSSGSGGILNIGDPSSGMGGDVGISNSMTVNTAGTALNVGGVGGSSGMLDVPTLSDLGTTTVNTGGEIDVSSSGVFADTTTVAGGEIKADQGVAIALGGTGSSVSGTGKLSAEINASFTFATGSTWAIGPGNPPPGSALNDGKFIVDGTLDFNTNFTSNSCDITVNNDGATTKGSIGGTGSVDWWNSEFDWNGGTIDPAGGFTIDDNSDFKVQGADPKTLGGTMTNLWLTAEFGGTGALSLMPGAKLLNECSAVGTMDVSLPTIGGFGTFDNAGKMSVTGASGLTISAILDNEAGGLIDCDSGAGPLTLSDSSGSSLLNGKLGLNDDSLKISGKYTTSTGFDEEFSPTDLTTLTGTLTVASGASADFDHVVLAYNGYSGGGVITGAGDFSIGASGLNTGDYLNWVNGTMSGTGTTTIGPYASLNLTGQITLTDREIDNNGTVTWSPGTLASISGSTIHNEKGGVFDFEDRSDTIPTFNNDGTVEVGSASTLRINTFTQSSTGTLQSHIAGASAFGVLDVTGSATLDGTLQAQLENGYQPLSGSSFKVLTGSNSGQFATIDPQGWNAQYNPSDVTLIAG